MRWTTKVPTKPGFYWIHTISGAVEIVNIMAIIVRRVTSVHAERWGMPLLFDAHRFPEGTRWSDGPIRLPKGMVKP